MRGGSMLQNLPAIIGKKRLSQMRRGSMLQNLIFQIDETIVIMIVELQGEDKRFSPMRGESMLQNLLDEKWKYAPEFALPD